MALRLAALAALFVMFCAVPGAQAQDRPQLPSLFKDTDPDGQPKPDDEVAKPAPKIDRALLDTSAPGVADCPNAPADAYIYVPDPIYKWAQLLCRDEGYSLGPADGYDWRTMTGGAFEVSARSNDDLVASEEQLPYFTTMGVAQLNTSQALHAVELIDALLGQLPISARPTIDKSAFTDYWRLYMLTKGQVQVDLYFFIVDGMPQYFIFCENACAGGRKPQIVRAIPSAALLEQLGQAR